MTGVQTCALPILAGSAQHNSDVVLLLYEYMLDVSTCLKDGSWQMQPDNPIKAWRVTIKNADIRRFSDDAYTLFSPGSRLRFQFRSGDSDPYQIGSMYIEESPFSDDGTEFSFAGSNAIGFQLAKQTFDERTAYSGERSAVITQMLQDAGIPRYQMVVQVDTTAVTWMFKDSDTYLTGLQIACQASGWYLDDLPDGRIIIGNLAFMRSYIEIGRAHV